MFGEFQNSIMWRWPEFDFNKNTHTHTKTVFVEKRSRCQGAGIVQTNNSYKNWNRLDATKYSNVFGQWWNMFTWQRMGTRIGLLLSVEFIVKKCNNLWTYRNDGIFVHKGNLSATELFLFIVFRLCDRIFFGSKLLLLKMTTTLELRQTH